MPWLLLWLPILRCRASFAAALRLTDPTVDPKSFFRLACVAWRCGIGPGWPWRYYGCYIMVIISVQIRAGPAEERGRVCRFNEPSDEVAFLNLRTSVFFSELEVAPFGAFSCPKLRFWNYFFFRVLGTQKSFSIQSCFALSWK